MGWTQDELALKRILMILHPPFESWVFIMIIRHSLEWNKNQSALKHLLYLNYEYYLVHVHLWIILAESIVSCLQYASVECHSKCEGTMPGHDHGQREYYKALFDPPGNNASISKPDFCSFASLIYSDKQFAYASGNRFHFGERVIPLYGF